MTEAEVRATMRKRGWTYKIRQPKGVARYIYAQRREGREIVERYICPLSRLGNLTEVELAAKLALIPEPAEETSSEERAPKISDTTNPPTNTEKL